MEKSITLYKVLKKQKPIARFGFFRTSFGEYDMPCIVPSIINERDTVALYKNIQKGLNVKVISPKASCRKALSILKPLISPKKEALVKVPRLLIIADPESEALSISCNARKRFSKDNIPAPIKPLFSTGLTSDSEKKRREVYSAWKEVKKKFGFAVLKTWAENVQKSVYSDIFLAPTPIIQNNLKTIDKAFEYGYTMLDDALSEPIFTLNGLHLLLHAEIFRENTEAEIIRKKIINEINSWSGEKSRYKGSVLSLKLYDQNGRFTYPSSGTNYRKTFSDFLQQLSKEIRTADGILICHCFGNWGIGVLDSGSDISTFNISGLMRKIDVPMQRKEGKIGTLPTPPIFDIATLVEIDLKSVKKEFKKEGGFPLPNCVEMKKYWTEKKWSEKKIYANRTRCGALVEVGFEYQNAGLNKDIYDDIPLSEALKNRIKNSRIQQELIDFCPSLTNLHLTEFEKEFHK